MLSQALRTIASLSNRLSLDIGVSLVLSSPRSRLISVLAAISSVYRVEILIISSSKAFISPIAYELISLLYCPYIGQGYIEFLINRTFNLVKQEFYKLLLGKLHIQIVIFILQLKGLVSPLYILYSKRNFSILIYKAITLQAKYQL